MLIDHSFSFKGYISNKKLLIEQLNLAADVTTVDLVEAAFNQWALDLNRHLAGDYSIILPLKTTNQIFICLSAFSSHALFYQQDNNELSISDRSQDFNNNAEVCPFAISQLLAWGYIVAPQTLLSNIQTLNNGHSQLWQLSPAIELVSSKQLTLSEKIHSASAEPQQTLIANTTVVDRVSPDVFNQLPSLSHILNQPVSAEWQIQFLLTLQQRTDQTEIISDEGLNLLVNHQSPMIKEKAKFGKKIYRHSLKRYQKPIKKLKECIVHLYQAEISNWLDADVPSFETWLMLSYELPNRWYQQRLIAQSLAQKITFIYTDNTQIKTLIATQVQGVQPLPTQPQLFNLADQSIVNIFDAMQRLMHHGFTPVTHQLFHIVPPVSAKLISYYPRFPAQVTQFCYLALTLDHLARHSAWSVS